MSQSEPKTPSYRLHKATGQAVVTLNGSDFYLGRFGSSASREAFDRLIGEWLSNGRHFAPSRNGTITINELFKSYWKHVREYYRKNNEPTREQANVKIAMRVLCRRYGGSCARGFGPIALKTIRHDLISSGSSRSYVNDQVGRIKRMFKWAVENELVPPTVYHGLQAVAGLKRGRCEARETDPVRPVPDQFVNAIQPHVARQVWAIIEIQRLTGMRSGEMLIMRGRDLDMTGSIWLYRPESHKTQHHGHERVVELGPRAQTIIRPFLRPDLEAYLYSPQDAVAEQKTGKRCRRKSKVQPSQQDRSKPNPKRYPSNRYTTDSYRRAITRACDKADAEARKKLPPSDEPKRVIPRWHPHQLRHNFATAVRKQYGIEIARILLGHRSAAVTEIYAEADRAKAREIMTKIG